MVLAQDQVTVYTSRRVTLLNDPYINEFNGLMWTQGQDNRGYQYQIALDLLPPGIDLGLIQQGQIWFISNDTTAYRLEKYLGTGISIANYLTTPGDTFVATASGVVARVPLGSNNQVLTVSGGTVVWDAVNTLVSGLPGPTVSGYVLALSGTVPTWTAQYPTGTVNQVLTLSGTVPIPQWMTPTVTPGVPTGTILDFAGPAVNVPTGYLVCDGASYSTTTYATLFAALAYTWGGSGANFNVPDLRGKVTIGVSGSAYPLATLGGEFLHVLGSGETPLNVHTHGFTVPALTFTVPSSTGSTTASTTTGSLSIPGSTYSTGSNTTGITSAPNSLTAAGQTATVTEPNSNQGHHHTPSNTTMIGSVTAATSLGNGVAAGGGYKYVGLYQDTAVPVLYGGYSTTGITISNASSAVTGTITITDPGHLHSIPAMTTTGSLTIPALTFTVPSSTGSTTISTGNSTATNTAITTVSGHNNMQPYAAVYKIIKT